MRFKLDENLPTEIALALQLSGHDADTVKDEGLEREPDSVIMATALKAARVLLTLDKGIADVACYPKGAHAGVVLFRPGSSGRGVVAGKLSFGNTSLDYCNANWKVSSVS